MLTLGAFPVQTLRCVKNVRGNRPSLPLPVIATPSAVSLGRGRRQPGSQGWWVVPEGDSDGSGWVLFARCVIFKYVRQNVPLPSQQTLAVLRHFLGRLCAPWGRPAQGLGVLFGCAAALLDYVHYYSLRTAVASSTYTSIHT